MKTASLAPHGAPARAAELSGTVLFTSRNQRNRNCRSARRGTSHANGYAGFAALVVVLLALLTACLGFQQTGRDEAGSQRAPN